MAHDSRKVWQQCSLTKFRALIGDRKLRLILLFGQPAAEPRSESEVNIIIPWRKDVLHIGSRVILKSLSLDG